jgi:hypothetical protein
MGLLAAIRDAVRDVGTGEVAPGPPGPPGPPAPAETGDGLLGWYPPGEPPKAAYMHSCSCGCSQADMGPCWQCGRMVRP